MRTFFLIIVITLVFITPPATYAGEDELYDPEPPAGSAFVRAINANEQNSSADFTIGNTNINSLSYPSASPYFVIKEGKYSVSSSGIESEIKIEAGKYYSLIITSDKIREIEDMIIEDPAKSRIYFYNFSDKKANLTAPVHKTSIFTDIESGKNISREINAITLDIAIDSEGQNISSFKNIQLKRKRGTIFIIVGSKGNYKTFTTENEIKL